MNGRGRLRRTTRWCWWVHLEHFTILASKMWSQVAHEGHFSHMDSLCVTCDVVSTPTQQSVVVVFFLFFLIDRNLRPYWIHSNTSRTEITSQLRQFVAEGTGRASPSAQRGKRRGKKKSSKPRVIKQAGELDAVRKLWVHVRVNQAENPDSKILFFFFSSADHEAATRSKRLRHEPPVEKRCSDWMFVNWLCSSAQ